jgi:hypothetical protein
MCAFWGTAIQGTLGGGRPPLLMQKGRGQASPSDAVGAEDACQPPQDTEEPQVDSEGHEETT